MSRTQELYEFASKYMVAGVSSSVRLSKALGFPFYTLKGIGSKVFDVEGKEYIDFCMSHGASFLGHDNPMIREAIMKGLELGIICSHETEYHSKFAKQICDMVPCCELVRFTCSGTDATLNAIRLAREYTKKDKIIQFEGCFHGYHENVMFSTHPPLELAGPENNPNAVPTSEGIPKKISELVKILPYNNIDILEKEIKRSKNEVAAVIIEPIGYNSGCMTPKKEFLEALRVLTKDNDIILIFDEILSGFRMCKGGVQEYYNIIPDICTLGKAIAGGGGPLSAFGGKREFMEHIKPLGKVQHSGTYNGHLLSVLAGIASLEQISSDGFYDHINNLAEKLYKGFNDILEKKKIKGLVRGIGGMFGIFFGLEEEPVNYRVIIKNYDQDKILKFYREAHNLGLYFADYGGGPAHHGFSSAHTLKDIDETLDKIEIIMEKL